MNHTPITWLTKSACETHFGSYPPEFIRYPHVVFKSSRMTCALVADEMDSIPAPWPQIPLFNAQGLLDLDSKAGFKEWLQPFAREEFFQKWCEGRAQASNNVVLVDANAVDEQVEVALHNFMSEPFPAALRNIQQVLDRLDWVGRALDTDADFIAFFFSPRIQNRRASLASRAAHQGINIWQISVGSNGLLLSPSLS